MNTPLHKLSFFTQLFILLLGAAGSADAQMASASSEACPKLPQMTYDEDGEFLRSDCRSHFLDPLQFIPLGQNENNYLSFGYWIRERGELGTNPNFSHHPLETPISCSAPFYIWIFTSVIASPSSASWRAVSVGKMNLSGDLKK